MHTPKQIFVNLPVKDLEKTKAFFAALGFGFDPVFTNEQAAAMIVSEKNGMYTMLITEELFKTFTKKEIADSSKTTEVILSYALDSRDAVNEMVEKALASGAMPSLDASDYGWMLTRSFQDLDGHIWEFCHIDENHPEFPGNKA